MSAAMVHKALTVLLAATCGFMGWRSFEAIGLTQRADSTNLAASRTTAPPPPAAIALPRFDMPPIEAFHEIVSRPLFDPSRRPVSSTGSGKGLHAVEVNFLLSGIVIDANQRFAQFKSKTDGRVRTLGIGETIENWRIEAIEPAHVILRAGERAATVYLRRPEPRRPVGQASTPAGRKNVNPILRGRNDPGPLPESPDQVKHR